MFAYDRKLFRPIAVALLAMSLTMPAAQADDDDRDEKYGRNYSEKSGGKYGGENRGKPLQPAQTNAKFQQECSGCHIAYAPGLLPAESWRKVMSGLGDHFGVDASLDANDNQEITAFLVNNASNRWRAQTAPLKISEAGWFRHKHDAHEIDPAVWKNPKVNSPANCAACHLKAEQGDFSERGIRVPR